MRGGLTIIAAGVLLGAPAAPAWAQDNNGGESFDLGVRLVKGGTWAFSSSRLTPQGEPVCRESWTFSNDGSAKLVSGEARITVAWRARVDDSGREWLYFTGVSVSGGPDCTGVKADPASYPRPEVGFILQFYNGGYAATCRPPRPSMRRTSQYRARRTAGARSSPAGSLARPVTRNTSPVLLVS